MSSTHPEPASALLDILFASFGICGGEARLIGRSQNAVYDCGPDHPILRVSHGRERTKPQVEAELEWIAALAARGIDVCLPRRSQAGRRCEHFVIGGEDYLVSAFERAPGRKVMAADVDDARYRQLGCLTAQLHVASFDDVAGDAFADARPLWHDSRLLVADVEKHLPPDHDAFRRRVAEMLGNLKLRVARTALIHADVSFTNVFLDGDRLWLFDFDNCERGPIEQDLATVIYDAIYCHWLNRVPPADFVERVQHSWHAFLAGYRAVRKLGDVDLEALRQFLILREAIIYVHYCRVLDGQMITPGFRSGMDEMRAKVESGSPPIDLAWLEGK